MFLPEPARMQKSSEVLIAFKLVTNLIDCLVVFGVPDNTVELCRTPPQCGNNIPSVKT